jgi:hypothetical protein
MRKRLGKSMVVVAMVIILAIIVGKARNKRKWI